MFPSGAGKPILLGIEPIHLSEQKVIKDSDTQGLSLNKPPAVSCYQCLLVVYHCLPKHSIRDALGSIQAKSNEMYRNRFISEHCYFAT